MAKEMKTLTLILGTSRCLLRRNLSARATFVVTMRQLISAAVFAGVCLMTSSSARAEYVMASTIFGHQVYVSKQPGENRLMIDGTARLTDGRIDILEIGLAGDLPVVIGWIGSGGNMCGSVPFVISFSKGAPKLSVSHLKCFQMEWTLGDRQIIFKVPQPDGNGPKFLWTHNDGFVELK